MNPHDQLPFARRGQDVTIWPQAKITHAESISLGDSVIIDDFVLLMGGSATTIGSFVHLASFTSITGGGEFSMGDFSGLAGGVRILTGSDDFSGACLTNPTVPAPFRRPKRSFVRLQEHALVGANTVVMPGVTIGEGAAIGANSLVTKDCEPWMIYFGSPARPLKRRPRETMLAYAAEIRRQCYDAAGAYLPRRQWTGLHLPA